MKDKEIKTNKKETNQDAENSFFETAPLESIDSIIDTGNWKDDDPAIKDGKKNILRFVLIKSFTILIIAYIIVGYKLDIQYYFQEEAVKDFGKVTIESVNSLKMDEFKKYNNTIASISGWVEIESSFSMKLNFERYKILKLWRKPIFVVLDKNSEAFVSKEGTSSDIPYLKEVKGRLITYKNLSNGISLLNSYDGIITAYKKSIRKRLLSNRRPDDNPETIKAIINQKINNFSKDGVIILVNQLPKQNIWSLVIPGLLSLYILYSIFAIIRIFLSIKREKEEATSV